MKRVLIGDLPRGFIRIGTDNDQAAARRPILILQRSGAEHDAGFLQPYLVFEMGR